jgi:polysaccharide biosynthesis transport protein
VPPNPSELLNSPTFAALAHSFLDAGYDHVIYDSPPVLSVADAVVLASAVDTCVLVVRAERTPRQSVRVAVDKVRQVGGVSFGLVLNDLDPERHGAARYGYHRAYGRYGEDVADDEPRSATGA